MKKITIILQPGYSLVVIVDKLHYKINNQFIPFVWKELAYYIDTVTGVKKDTGAIEFVTEVPDTIVHTIQMHS